MTLLRNSIDEFKRSPITVVATVLGVGVSIAALITAGAVSTAPAPPSAAPMRVEVGNLFVVVAFCLASSLSLASAIRLLARSHWFAALLLSLPAAVLSGFGTMLVLHKLPPKSFAPDALSAVQDIALWCTCIIFIAINGFAAIRDFVNPRPGDDSDYSYGQAFAWALLLIAGWCMLVSKGLSKLVEAFLT